jgi:hypothetical protein
MPFRPRPWPQYHYFASVPLLMVDWLAGANVRAVGFAAYPTLRMGLLPGRLPVWHRGPAVPHLVGAGNAGRGHSEHHGAAAVGAGPTLYVRRGEPCGTTGSLPAADD